MLYITDERAEFALILQQGLLFSFLFGGGGFTESNERHSTH